jgi:hypothetical protein
MRVRTCARLPKGDSEPICQIISRIVLTIVLKSDKIYRMNELPLQPGVIVACAGRAVAISSRGRIVWRQFRRR